MVTAQPFFIGGIEDPEHAQTSAFGAFSMFLGTFCLSAIGMWYDSQSKPEPAAAENGEPEYQLASDNFPNYGTSS